jgi:spore germination protein YaaH
MKDIGNLERLRYYMDMKHVRSHQYTIKSIIAFLFVSILLIGMPHATVVAKGESLEIAGWIPYWSKTGGMKSATKHMETLDMVYPFVYTVKSDGTLKDNGSVNGKDWKTFFKTARAEGVPVIPTIMSGDGALIGSILSNPSTRALHIKAITGAVKKGKFDGIDIDYEGRTRASVNDFSLFLKELKAALGSKKLVCTLEPRTPPDSLWREVPNPLPYSNDYREIGKHCDIIQIMTYDQQRADIKLNALRMGEPYYPNADPAWVEKVIALTVQELPREKIMLGVPTYGRHILLTVEPERFSGYDGLGAVNRDGALALQRKHKATVSKNAAGEQSFTYLPESLPAKVKNSIGRTKVASGTSEGMKIALQALAYANKTGETVPVHMVWWSDAAAIQDKIDLAKKYKLRGIAIFKIDGDEDPLLWRYVKE